MSRCVIRKEVSRSFFPFLLLGAAVPLSSAQTQSGSAALSGQYAFYLTGQEQLPSGASDLEAIAGSFAADGQGRITSGVLDKNSSTGLVQVSNLTGVYTVDAATGKGTVSLQLPAGPLNLTFYSQLPLPAPSANNAPIDAAIVAGGGSLLNGTGRLANAVTSSPASTTFSLDGEAPAGGGAVSGTASLNIASSGAGITGQAVLIENGAASTYPSLTGTATAVNATGRYTVSLAGLGKGAADYAMYQGKFSTGGSVFLSLNPNSSAPLLVGTNGMSLPSYFIEYFGTEDF